MDFDTTPRDDYSPDREPDDIPREAPFVAPKPAWKRRGALAAGIVIVLLVVTAGVFYAFRSGVIRFERTDRSLTLTIGQTEEQAATEVSAPADASAYLGTGKKLPLDPSAPGAPNLPSSAPGALSLQEIYEKAIPSVVTVTASYPRATLLGTAVVLSEDGYLLTNAHVVDGALTLSISMHDGARYDAVPVGIDTASDLAVMKIEAEGLTAAAFGDSEKLRVGDLAVAIGSPLSGELSGTMTDGIISGISRDLTINGRKMSLIQTNAALNNGNSGGPLLNCYGQVVGVNTIKLSRTYSSASIEGMGFAIPSAIVKPIVDELIEKGYVSGRPSLGVSVEELPDRARIFYGLPSGVYVTSVQPGSDAEQQGLLPGDVITALEGQSVTSVAALEQIRNNYAAGDTVELTVYRGGLFFVLNVRLMDRMQGD